MTRQLAEWIWLVGGGLWIVVRFPHERRARRMRIARSVGGRSDQLRLLASLIGLALVPLAYFVTGFGGFADYRFRPVQGWVGAVLIAGALAVLYETHRQLGRNFSITLNTRKKHKLVTTGIYAFVRHPMYSAFWLLALAQAALLANWIAGPAGVVGWGILFFLRVGKEEQLMTETFGDEYSAYTRRTRRVIPWVY